MRFLWLCVRRYFIGGSGQLFFVQCGPETPKDWTPLLGDVSAKILWCDIPEILLLVFSSRIFIGSGLTFKSSIHFEFIFVCSIRKWSNLIFYMYLSSFFNTTYWRDCLCSIVCSCPLCQISIDHKSVGLFLGSLFCCIDLSACSYGSTRLFWSQ